MAVIHTDVLTMRRAIVLAEKFRGRHESAFDDKETFDAVAGPGAFESTSPDVRRFARHFVRKANSRAAADRYLSDNPGVGELDGSGRLE